QSSTSLRRPPSRFMLYAPAPTDISSLSLHDALPILIINETHSLLPDQVRELREKGFDNYEEIRIPKEGWDARTRLSRAHEWAGRDRKSTRLNSSHVKSSYAVFCLKKKNSRPKATCTT